MKRLLLILIIASYNIGLMAQSVVPVSLDHGEMYSQEFQNTEVNYLTFDNAINLPKYGAFPVFTKEVELPAQLFECEIEIFVIGADTLDKTTSSILTDNDLVGRDFSHTITYNNGSAILNILPFKWNKDENQIIRLTDFEIVLDFVPIEENIRGNAQNSSYVIESVLAKGQWSKMGIVNDGIHIITYEDISSMGFIPEDLDVNKFGIYGNYNGLLPEANNKARKDDLHENSIYAIGTEDGKFDEGDKILFYAQAPTTWKYNPFTGRFDHEINLYSDTSYYFFTPDMGTAKSITYLENSTEEPTHFVSSFIDYDVHENEYENMISSGKEWYGERFEGDTLEREFVFNFPNIIKTEPAFIGMEIIGRSLKDSYYNVYVNDNQIVDSSRIRYISSTLGIFARKSSVANTFFSQNDKLDIVIDFQSEDANAIGWLDYITINAVRELIFTGNQMRFCNPQANALGNITEYTIRGGSNSDLVWDITDIHNPRIVNTTYNDGNVKFTLPTDSLKTFTITNGQEYYSPVNYVDIENQNLHAISDVNFVIIRPEIFSTQAEQLANIHRHHDGLSTVVVSPEQIYNEFSSGSQDISAIRDFMRMLYKKGAFGNERAYLLMFGDASFDYKHRIHDNTNMVPTYESLESLRETGSFVTDDYFGLLDDNEGASVSGELDIGIGRFPISTVDEANTAIEKIENYLLQKEGIMADWRTNLCFVADDRDNNLHLKQAEGLVEIADTLHSGIGINKIFLDSYKKITVPGGFRYPDVNKKINQQMDEGALILNYTGHGGLIGWSDELVLDVPMINAFDNFDNMPLIITATCEFSRFDNPEFTSAGEYTFLNQEGGAIGLLTTTRLAYAHANYIVNRRIYTNLLSCDDQGSRPRLGDLVRLSKIPSNENYLNFVLLGDPALTLAYPQYDVVTTSNSAKISVNDTVKALTLINVEGEIVDKQGARVEDFNGYVYPKVVDKASKYTTLGNDGNSYPQDFLLFDKVLFDGKVLVENGQFNFEFMVPKDINYDYGMGKIRYYALDTNNMVDAWGAFEELLIGGINEDADIDDIGPEIDIYLNSTAFNNGDEVTGSPVMLSYINDESGINNTGNGLGRDMVMVLDNNYANPTLVNELFQMDVNSYKSGKIILPFNDLSDGYHTITIKAWDLQNNSSEKTIEFIVNDGAAIALSQVINYPNPFFDETEFQFVHNKSGVNLSATIRIFDLNGRFVVELKEDNGTSGSSGSIKWNGRNQNNEVVSPGIYVYTVEVSDEYDNVTVQQQKLFKISK